MVIGGTGIYLETTEENSVIGIHSSMIELGGKIGFFGATPIAKTTVDGTKSGISALASLITQLAKLGLITDGTS